ncbi:glycosyltransferase family 2 protein [Selenomonas sp. KH1T6]|uniref:glycosyltransferase family 2 protein n=1 Tax=Selenomonas sp. KH1T6 TaxID=3158784 RepID=UPI001587C8BE
MKDIKVSVMLPSLNVGMYIKECIESVINQTLKDIEIICVDAGSTDGTLETIKEFMAKDDRIMLINSSKKSYGHQMNLAMEAATGEYVGIVETDDFVPGNMFEDLYKIAKKNNVDFVKADFYRFKENADGTLDKTLFKLSDSKWYYNRIIDIAQEPECFNFVLNTWSGIYKRSFIVDNNIRHNETPGASFQDNGFWFQTFMHAHRAYFVDKPYYMNRRDNPNSSVYDTSKIYVICDEYEYILSVLEKYPDLFELFKGQYTQKLLENYLWTLERIHYENKPVFYERLQKVFRGLAEKGMVDYKVIAQHSERQVYDIYEILHNPQHWYDRVYGLSEDVIKGLEHESTIYLYGAGELGKLCYDILEREGLAHKVKGFIVSKKSAADKPYKGMPIFTMADVAEQKDALVLITVKPLYKKEIRENLYQEGFIKVKSWPDAAFIRGTEMSLHSKIWEEKVTKNFTFPFDMVKKGSRIVLYGAGKMGQVYFRQLRQTGYADIVSWIDEDSQRYDYLSKYMEVLPELTLEETEYDYAVIAFNDQKQAKNSYWRLLSVGVPFEKIVWNGSSMGKTFDDLLEQDMISVLWREQKRQLDVMQKNLEQRRKKLTEDKTKTMRDILKQAQMSEGSVAPFLSMNLTQESTQDDVENIMQDCAVCMDFRLEGKDVFALKNIYEILMSLKNDSRIEHISIYTESATKPQKEVLGLLKDLSFEVRIKLKQPTEPGEELMEILGDNNICCDIDYGRACPELVAEE